MVSFRYNVICGLSPGEQEPVYAEAAKRIADGAVSKAADALQLLARIYPTDEVFVVSFVDKVFTKGREKLVRHILCEMEKQKGHVPIDPESDTLTIEHVLPQSPESGWEAFEEQELEAMTFRLANMVLMRKSQNSALGNRPWTEKRPVLLASEFALTRELAEENSEWNPSRLMGRQQKLANWATGIWRVAQLS